MAGVAVVVNVVVGGAAVVAITFVLVAVANSTGIVVAIASNFHIQRCVLVHVGGWRIGSG